MGMPDLKRITIASERELAVWLSKHAGDEERVMLVTHTNPSHRKHVSREQVGALLAESQWKAGPRYTLGSHLLGHVITKTGA